MMGGIWKGNLLAGTAVRSGRAQNSQNVIQHICQPSFNESHAARLMLRVFSAGPSSAAWDVPGTVTYTAIVPGGARAPRCIKVFKRP